MRCKPLTGGWRIVCQAGGRDCSAAAHPSACTRASSQTWSATNLQHSIRLALLRHHCALRSPFQSLPSQGNFCLPDDVESPAFGFSFFGVAVLSAAEAAPAFASALSAVAAAEEFELASDFDSTFLSPLAPDLLSTTGFASAKNKLLIGSESRKC